MSARAAPLMAPVRFPSLEIHRRQANLAESDLMLPTITPKQTLFLWRLLVEPNGVFVGKAKPELTAKERGQLVGLGLVSLEKRKATPKSRAVNFAILSEKGWNWASQNLDAPLPTQGTAALGVLALLLMAMKNRIDAGELSLAKLLAPIPPALNAPLTGLPPRPDRSGMVEAAVRQAAGGMLQGKGEGTRVRLAELRSRLPDLPRQEVDRLLLAWEQEGKAALYPLDDPREIQQADELAALANIAGKNRHVLYLKPQ